MDDSDSNYTLEDDEYEDSFENSFDDSVYSLEVHRNIQMNLDDDDDTNQEPEIIDEIDEHRSNKTSSDVWEHIDKLTDPTKPKCKHCGKIFSKRSSTTTLRNHLKKYHKLIHKEANQTTLKFNSTSFYDKKTNSKYVELLLKWIVIDMSF